MPPSAAPRSPSRQPRTHPEGRAAPRRPWRAVGRRTRVYVPGAGDGRASRSRPAVPALGQARGLGARSCRRLPRSSAPESAAPRRPRRPPHAGGASPRGTKPPAPRSAGIGPGRPRVPHCPGPGARRPQPRFPRFPRSLRFPAVPPVSRRSPRFPRVTWRRPAPHRRCRPSSARRTVPSRRPPPPLAPPLLPAGQWRGGRAPHLA